MRLRAEEGDEFAAPQARSVEVESRVIHLAQRTGLNKEQFDELYALAPKYAAQHDEELRKRAADFEKAVACFASTRRLALREERIARPAKCSGAKS